MKTFAFRELQFDITDENNKRVLWYKDSYDSHLEIHPDIKKYVHLIPEILKSCQIRKKEGNYIHYYHPVRIDKRGKQLYLRIVVNYNPDPANISTAHLTSNIK